MSVLFSQQFETESADKLGIKRDSALSTVTKPDREETVQVGDDLTLRFFYKTLPQASNSLGLLVYGIKLPNDDLNLVRGFKIYPDLCEGLDSKRPTQILMELANRFGFQITIGRHTEFFFFHQTLSVDLESNAPPLNQPTDLLTKVINIHAKKGREFTTEFLFKHNVQKDKLIIDCALVFAIDLDDYRKWVLHH